MIIHVFCVLILDGALLYLTLLIFILICYIIDKLYLRLALSSLTHNFTFNLIKLIIGNYLLLIQILYFVLAELICSIITIIFIRIISYLFIFIDFLRVNFIFSIVSLLLAHIL